MARLIKSVLYFFIVFCLLYLYGYNRVSSLDSFKFASLSLFAGLLAGILIVSMAGEKVTIEDSLEEIFMFLFFLSMCAGFFIDVYVDIFVLN